MTNKGSGVLFVGALTLDTLYHVDDFSSGPGKYPANNTVTIASGMAATAATAAARLGGKSALWASVGGDVTAPALIAEIAAEGVDCTHVRRVTDGRSASATIIVDDTGERWVLIDYDPVTQSAPEPHSIPPMDDYAAVMVDVRWPSAARLALDAAKKAGLFAILDADVTTAEILNELAPCATHIIASAQGAAILSSNKNPEEAAQIIAARFGSFVCVTDGENGSFWTDNDSAEVHHVPSPQVVVVDTNGAGDVFHGAFAQALATGSPPQQAIEFASAAAALKCTILGGRLGAPNRTKTLQLMKETYHDGS